MMLVSFVPLFANRVYLNGDQAGEVVVTALLMVPWHTLNMFVIHWVITKVGFLFVDAEVLR